MIQESNWKICLFLVDLHNFKKVKMRAVRGKQMNKDL